MAGKRTAPDAGRGRLQRPLAELCCVNPECPDAGQRDIGNLSVRVGKGSGRCELRSSERRLGDAEQPTATGVGAPGRSRSDW